MILTHISQGTDTVIKSTSLLNSDRFNDTDIYLFNKTLVPIEFKEVVGKTEVKDILQHFLREIMVDTIYLLFLENLSKKIV